MAGKSGKNSKKKGRNSHECLAYKNSNRREKNKLIRLERHLKKVQPGDPVALAAVEKYKKVVKGY